MQTALKVPIKIFYDNTQFFLNALENVKKAKLYKSKML